MRIIGDIHGKAELYLSKIRDQPCSIQLGDLGIGFGMERIPLVPRKHRFIRGNHDSTELAPKLVNHLPSGFRSEPWGDFFTLEGGFSIDRAYRIEGVDWWRDEEHSYKELDELISTYKQTRPSIVLSHEGPTQIIEELFSPSLYQPSRTSQALQTMLDSHVPDLWLFGHWHRSDSLTRWGCEFRCLAEGETFDITP